MLKVSLSPLMCTKKKGNCICVYIYALPRPTETTFQSCLREVGVRGCEVRIFRCWLYHSLYCPLPQPPTSFCWCTVDQEMAISMVIYPFALGNKIIGCFMRDGEDGTTKWTWYDSVCFNCESPSLPPSTPASKQQQTNLNVEPVFGWIDILF